MARDRERPRKLHVDAVGALLIDGKLMPEQASALVRLHGDAVRACLMPRVTGSYSGRSEAGGDVVNPKVFDARRRFNQAMTAIKDQAQKEAVQFVALWPGDAPVDGAMLQDLRDGADVLCDHYERSTAELERRMLDEERVKR